MENRWLQRHPENSQSPDWSALGLQNSPRASLMFQWDFHFCHFCLSPSLRTACTSLYIYSTVSATTGSSPPHPLCFSSTRRISLRRKSRKSTSVSASLITMVCWTCYHFQWSALLKCPINEVIVTSFIPVNEMMSWGKIFLLCS